MICATSLHPQYTRLRSVMQLGYTIQGLQESAPYGSAQLRKRLLYHGLQSRTQSARII